MAVGLLGFGQAWGALPATVPPNVPAAISNDKGLDAAIASGDFTGYLAALSASVNQKMRPGASGVSEAALKALFANPVFANTLARRQLIAKIGADKIGAFARADPNNKAFLAWLLRNTQAMELYLEGGTPTGLKAREANTYTLPIASLDIWKRIYHADPDSKEGLCLRLAIATALAPPGSGARGAGQPAAPPDPVDRYKYFKAARENKELFPSFDDLTVWDYEKVVSSGASDSDLTWARDMINTWRPDLRINEQVVNSTSEVWRRDSPHPYTDYKSVLSGGGKCGPRSSWSVMICQAFGIPAIGVGQPGHACVAYKTIAPSLQPQPGNVWKVGYGAGWAVSKLDGLSGPEFVEGVEARMRTAEFSLVEHLRWLASAIASKEQAGAVMGVVHKITQATPATKTDLKASERAEEANQEVAPAPATAKAASAPASTPEPPFKVMPGVLHVEAESFARMSGVLVLDCYTGGKQVNFQKNMNEGWIEYTVDVPAAGVYGMIMRTAAANVDQKFDVSCGGTKLAAVDVPMSTGLWATTPQVDLKLARGTQTLRISAPYQRGIAVRWFELGPQGTKGSPQGLRTTPLPQR